MSKTMSRHFADVRARMLAHFEHIADTTEHGDVKGAAREGLVRLFLSENLPSIVECVTGEIIDRYDNRSGQLDLVLQSRAAPKIAVFGSIQTTLVDAALGVIEVKSTLKTGAPDKPSALAQALDTFKKVKALKRDRKHLVGGNIGLQPVYHANTPCFLVAYKGPNPETLVEGLGAYGKHHELDSDAYAPELICVLDRAYFVYRDNGWLFGQNEQQFKEEFRVWEGHSCLEGLFVYICRIVETWHGLQHSTPFSEYLG